MESVNKALEVSEDILQYLQIKVNESQNEIDPNLEQEEMSEYGLEDELELAESQSLN